MKNMEVWEENIAKTTNKRMLEQMVENPPAEATPDFAYKPCEGFQETVIEESQKEEEAGLALCTFPAPYSCVCSRGPRTPILTGADVGQPKSVGHALADLEVKFVVPHGKDPTSPTKRDAITTLTVDCGRILGVEPKPPLACGI